jgi:hypothetical protein
MKRRLILDSLGDDFDGGLIANNPRYLARAYDKIKTLPEFSLICKPLTDGHSADCLKLMKNIQNAWGVIDEVDRYMSPWNTNPDLKEIINYGRHRPVSLLAIARRPAAVARELTASADCIIAHQTTEKRDLEYLASFMDVSPLPTLKPFEWLASAPFSLWGDHAAA